MIAASLFEISEEDYKQQKAFWDAWKCSECNPDYRGALKRFQNDQEYRRAIMYIQSEALHYQDHRINSDKVYFIAIAKTPNGQYNVYFAYGRRGNNLSRGIKNKQPLSLAAATSVFNEVVDSKMRKGYQYSSAIGNEFPVKKEG